MAGRARYHALRDILDKRTKDAFQDEEEDSPTIASHLDYVCYWVENGSTVKKLCAEIEKQMEEGLGRFVEFTYAQLMNYLRKQYGDAVVEQRMTESRARSSFTMAEDSLDIVDAYAETSAEVSRAASRAKSRMWLAEKYNRPAFGQEKNQLQVQINVGSLHLDALRSIRPQAIAVVEEQPKLTA